VLSEQWRRSRVDVSAGTMQTYRVALGRLLPRLGDTAVERIEAEDVAELVAELHAAGLRKQTIRKTLSVLAMVLDHGRVQPNPARDKLTVKLPREERRELHPPTAEHVEAVVRLLPTAYRLPALVLDATGMRIGELDALTWGDVDQPRQRWRVSGSVAKTGRRDGCRCQPSSSRPSRGSCRARIASRSVPSSRASVAIASEQRLRGPVPPPAFRASHRTISATAESRCSTWAECRGPGSASLSGTTTSLRPSGRTHTFSRMNSKSTTRQ
jgi:integrase